MPLNYEESATCPPEIGDICIIMFQGMLRPMIITSTQKPGRGYDWIVSGTIFVPYLAAQLVGGVVWKPAAHLSEQDGMTCWPKLTRGHAERLAEAEAIIEAHRKAVPPGYVKDAAHQAHDVDYFNHIDL
jgi:hypothetical protein